MKNARKIGFIFLEDNSVTKTWKKYVKKWKSLLTLTT